MIGVPRNLAKGQTAREIRKKIAYKGEEATTEKEVTKKREKEQARREREREKERENGNITVPFIS